MKKIISVLVVLVAFFGFSCSANAGWLDLPKTTAVAGPSKDIIQPAQGEKVANEYCWQKYSDDIVMRGACFMVLAGGVTKAKSGTDLQLNVPLERPIPDDVSRPAGKLMKCKAELVMLPGGTIGWSETSECSYK